MRLYNDAAEAAAHAINMAGGSRSQLTQRQRKTTTARDWRDTVSRHLIRGRGLARVMSLARKNITNIVRVKGLCK